MKPLFSKRAYVACQLGGWGSYLLLNVALLGAQATSPLLVAISFFSYSALGLVASHLLRWFAQRAHWQARPLGALAARIFLAALVLAVVTQALQFLFVVFVLRAFTWAEATALSFVFYVVQSSILLMLWQLIYFGVHALARSRRAELDALTSLAAMQSAELRALRTQLNPHFLFNALNTVRALISEDPARAQEAVTRLSALLRYALAAGETQIVSLEKELEVVQDYLALEVLRFEERLQVQLDVPASCLSAQVPVLLLQTLVENAVKHGIARCPAGGAVIVTARKQNGVLSIEVTNPSPQTPVSAESTGLGLVNTRERLRLLFGEHAQVELSAVGALTTARVSVPCP